jgi:hypothetical protein
LSSKEWDGAVVPARERQQQQHVDDHEGDEDDDSDEDDSIDIDYDGDQPMSASEAETDALADAFQDAKMARVLTSLPQPLTDESNFSIRYSRLTKKGCSRLW